MSLSDLSARLQAALGDAYHIERELGGGGMSRLFIAEESSLHRKVVVKVLPPEFTSEVSAERFRREIEVAAHLQHPNILPVLAAGTRDDLLYYVIPYVPGESLRHRLTQQGQLPVVEALQILRETADALAHAHSEGIIHRDIKPENILLLGGHAVLTDFGVARALVEARSGERLTETGLAVGTPGYMAPEQVAGDRHIDARADVYALAVVGYEMLTGKAPFEGPTAQAVLAAHLTATPKALSAVRSEVPPSASAAIARALAKNPAERLQTAAAFRDALKPTEVRPALSRRAGLILAGMAGIGVVTVTWALLSGRSGGSASDPNLVAVAPYDVVTSALDDYREGLVTILSQKMDGAGPLRTLSATQAVRRWSGQADPESAREFGLRTGAGLVIFGQAVPAGADSVRVTSRILDARSGVSLGEVEVTDLRDRIDRVADSTAIRVLRELGRVRPIGVVRLASLGSTSLPAIKLFLQAEQFYRRGQWESTLSYARRAVAIDSSFTLALRRIPNALWWGNTNTTPDLLRAGVHNHGLAPRESLLVQTDSIWGALTEGKAPQWPLLRRLETTLTEVTKRYPEDTEAWYMTGEMSFHYGGQVSPRRTRQQAFDAFARAIALDSAFAPAYGHIVELALGLQEPDEARRYAGAYLRFGAKQEDAASLRAAIDLLDHPRDPGPATRALFDTATAESIWDVWFHLRSGADSGEAAVAAARAFTASRHPRDRVDSIRQKNTLPSALAYRGHLREAVQAMWSAGDESVAGNVTLMNLLNLGAIPPDSAQRWLAGRLDRKDGWAPAGLGWWARQADTASLQRLAALAREKSGSGALATQDQEFWRYVAAASAPHLALARHDTATALRLFAQVPDSLCRACFSQRLTYARLLSASGQNTEAAALLEEPLHDSDWSSPTEVLWALERGRVNERLGKTDKALEAYGFVAAVWRNADPELQPLVQEAKAGLQRLSGEGKQ